MNKIQKLSRVLRYFFIFSQVAVVGIFAGICYILLGQHQLSYNLGSFIHLALVPSNIRLMHHLTIEDKWLIMALNGVNYGITFLSFYFASRLFHEYQQNHIFTTKAVKSISVIGWTLLASQIYQPLYQLFMSLGLTLANPPHYRMLFVSFNQHNVFMIILALLVITVSWIMHQGVIMQQEQSFTV